MQNDITVSKLSKLQKRILIYARQQTLAKGQKIEPPNEVTVCLPAPLWLNEALTTAMKRIFKVRKIGGGPLKEGGTDCMDMHPWRWFFEEMSFVERTIEAAAEAAGESVQRTGLTRLYEDAVPIWLWVRAPEDWVWKYHPWPSYDRGWYFKVNFENKTADEVVQLFGSKDEFEATGIWFHSGPDIPINCTIPELLRDLFDFPVDGHIDALAFSPKQIGEARYNQAQASVRRACSRLTDRGLVSRWWGQAHGLHVGFYERS